MAANVDFTRGSWCIAQWRWAYFDAAFWCTMSLPKALAGERKMQFNLCASRQSSCLRPSTRPSEAVAAERVNFVGRRDRLINSQVQHGCCTWIQHSMLYHYIGGFQHFWERDFLVSLCISGEARVFRLYWSARSRRYCNDFLFLELQCLVKRTDVCALSSFDDGSFIVASTPVLPEV